MSKMMKSSLGMLAFSAMALSSGLGGNKRERQIAPEENNEEKKKKLAKAEIELNKAHGLTEFFYGKYSVWAINQKNADRKAKLKKYI